MSLDQLGRFVADGLQKNGSALPWASRFEEGGEWEFFHWIRDNAELVGACANLLRVRFDPAALARAKAYYKQVYDIQRTDSYGDHIEVGIMVGSTYLPLGIMQSREKAPKLFVPNPKFIQLWASAMASLRDLQSCFSPLQGAVSVRSDTITRINGFLN